MIMLTKIFEEEITQIKNILFYIVCKVSSFCVQEETYVILALKDI